VLGLHQYGDLESQAFVIARSHSRMLLLMPRQAGVESAANAEIETKTSGLPIGEAFVSVGDHHLDTAFALNGADLFGNQITIKFAPEST